MRDIFKWLQSSALVFLNIATPNTKCHQSSRIKRLNTVCVNVCVRWATFPNWFIYLKVLLNWIFSISECGDYCYRCYFDDKMSVCMYVSRIGSCAAAKYFSFRLLSIKWFSIALSIWTLWNVKNVRLSSNQFDDASWNIEKGVTHAIQLLSNIWLCYT